MSSYTRAQVEQVLIRRVGQLLSFIGLNGTEYDGGNEDLNDPIAQAIRRLDGTVADPVDVEDSDVQTVAEADFDALLDIAELRVLQNVRGNLTLVDHVAGPFENDYGDIGGYLDKQIAALTKKVEIEHGIGGVEMEVGVITRDIASHDEDPITS